MHVSNLHVVPKRHLILKLELFLRKSILVWKNMKFARRFEGLKLEQSS